MTPGTVKRSFELSTRLRGDLERITLPLQIFQRPSPEVTALFWNAVSYLRFLDVTPRRNERWRFSLILTGQLERPENRCCLPRLKAPHRTVLMNLSDLDPIGVRLASTSIIPVNPLSGFVLEEEAMPAVWQLEEGSSHGVVPLLVASSTP